MRRALVAVVGLVLMLSGLAWGQAGGEGATITVAGRGLVQARPDRVTVQIGATAQADQAGAAQSQVNAVVQDTINKLKGLGIAEGKIRTAEINLRPVYVGRPQPPGVEPKEPEIVGYRATNLIRVESDDLGMVGKIIDTAVGAGANRVENISFELRDNATPRQTAIQLAVQEAAGKARAMAAAMGVQLGGVVEALEGSSYMPQPRVSFGRQALGEVATPVEPGQLNVEAYVTVKYRIAGERK